MSRPRALVAASIMSIALAACTGGGTPAPARSGGKQLQTSTLLARGVPLFSGTDGAIRIGFQPANDSARLNITFTPADARITLCGLSSIDADLPSPDACRQDVFSGVRQDVQSNGLRAVALLLSAGQARVDVSMDFDEAGRTVQLRLPFIPAPAGAADARVDRSELALSVQVVLTIST